MAPNKQTGSNVVTSKSQISSLILVVVIGFTAVIVYEGGYFNDFLGDFDFFDSFGSSTTMSMTSLSTSVHTSSTTVSSSSTTSTTVSSSSTTSTTVSLSSTTKNNEQIEAGVWIATYETYIIEENEQVIVTRTDKGTLSFTIDQNGDLVGIGESHWTRLYNDTESEWIVIGEADYIFEIFGHYFPDSENVTIAYSIYHNPETYEETSIVGGVSTVTNTKLIAVPILHPNINIKLKSGTTQVYFNGFQEVCSCYYFDSITII